MNAFWWRHMQLVMNLWPPFLGAGIRVKRLRSDWREIEVEMKLRRWNANFVGTHYGGSLYSMTDPFLMLMLINCLGRDYIVWDKAASIRFRRPGKGTVRAAFQISDRELDEIRQALLTEAKVERTFVVEVKDGAGEVIAQVEKLLYVRKKEGSSPATA